MWVEHETSRSIGYFVDMQAGCTRYQLSEAYTPAPYISKIMLLLVMA
jgi:hypothetical protein